MTVNKHTEFGFFFPCGLHTPMSTYLSGVDLALGFGGCPEPIQNVMEGRPSGVGLQAGTKSVDTGSSEIGLPNSRYTFPLSHFTFHQGSIRRGVLLFLMIPIIPPAWGPGVPLAPCWESTVASSVEVGVSALV